VKFIKKPCIPQIDFRQDFSTYEERDAIIEDLVKRGIYAKPEEG
jgi:hypothetical protein